MKRATRLTKGNAPKFFGLLHLSDAVVGFSARYPNIPVSLIIEDSSFRAYDFVDHGLDVTVRLRPIYVVYPPATRIPERVRLFVDSSLADWFANGALRKAKENDHQNRLARASWKSRQIF